MAGEPVTPHAPNSIEQLVFKHFWNGLAIGGAVTQWALWCWLLAGADVWPPAWMHVVVPLALAAAYRWSASVLETSRELPWWVDRLGQSVLATAFMGMIGAAAFGVAAVGWGLLGWLGGLQAEASLAGLFAEHGGGFRPAGIFVLGSTVAALLWGYTGGHRRLHVSEITVPVEGLPAQFDGYRIVHVSDLHLGPLAHRGLLRAALERASALDADLACVTGDIIDTPNADLDAWVPELRALRARDGVLAVLGNHDRHVGHDRVADAIERLTDWRVLRNEVASVRRDGARLCVVGHEDETLDIARERIPALLAGAPPDEPALLLIHHPALWETAAGYGVPVTFAGHTHGGQIAVPGVPAVNVARFVGIRWDRGLFERGQARLVVSRGLGVSGQRVRVGVPRDVTVVTLVAAGGRRDGARA